MPRLRTLTRAGTSTALALLLACGDDPPAPVNEAKTSVARVERAIEKFRALRAPPPPTDDPKLRVVIDAIRRTDPATAESTIAEVLAARPDYPHALYFRAFLAQRRKLYTAARPDFERVLEAGPVFRGWESVFLYYAWCCYYLADLDTARISFQAVIDLGVDPADGYYGLGMIAFDQGDLDAAVARFEASDPLFVAKQQTKPGPPDRSDWTDLAKSGVRLGAVLLKKADVDPAASAALLARARPKLEEAVKMVPWSDEAWFTLAQVYSRLGETELEQKARARYRQIKDGKG